VFFVSVCFICVCMCVVCICVVCVCVLCVCCTLYCAVRVLVDIDSSTHMPSFLAGAETTHHQVLSSGHGGPRLSSILGMED